MKCIQQCKGQRLSGAMFLFFLHENISLHTYSRTLSNPSPFRETETNMNSVFRVLTLEKENFRRNLNFAISLITNSLFKFHSVLDLLER